MKEFNTNYRMDEDFEIIGSWSLPGETLEKGLTGKLIYKDSSLKLEIYGDLNKSNFFEILNKENIVTPHILGYSNKGKLIIIEDAIRITYHGSTPGMPYSEYLVNRCLMINNDRYDIDEVLTEISRRGINNINCSTCKFSLQGMNKWMDLSIIKESKNDKSISITAQGDTFKIDEIYISNYNLVYSNDISYENRGNSLREEHYWKLNTVNTESMTLENFKQNIDLFRSLIQFFISTPVRYSFIEFELSLPCVEKKFIEAQYIYLQTAKVEDIIVSVSYKEIRSRFTEIMNNWYEKSGRLHFIIDNYLYDKNTNYFTEIKLLNSIRNLEIYHRNFINRDEDIKENEILKNIQNQLKEYIDHNVDEKYKERFLKSIGNNSENHLSNRIKELFTSVDDRILNRFLKLPEKTLAKSLKNYIRTLVDTRNYYVHGDRIEKYPMCIIEPMKQQEITIVLNKIVEYYIYKELHVLDENIIGKMLEIESFIFDNGKRGDVSKSMYFGSKI